ncbi:ABC transporter ATP-binding protein [Lacipirellula parvula]|uniref:Phospholipid ABC transporter ATP-binding protein MlaF n=1 Tax=Lacipirellula parvula TaxID=2650471 RepID=A0A5K7XHD8_9BACT|nr:ATP-binding cassette domain-containing protein [Lacipirellula parvula]BBO35407.1 phospholipid ABC transporter ATP-binding protein MlaF [Lacipirellula parvula]
MVSASPLIDLQSLTVRFGRQTVLRDVSISIPAGQTLAVIGESGCGKTVLLKTIIGLVTPTGGAVEFDGRQFGSLPERELAAQRTRFGFVFQNAALFDSMNVAENILFPLKQHRKDNAADQERAMHALLTEVGLPNTVLKKYPAELSGGMRKRVGLARALIMRPEAVLYDEPTTGLDPIMSDVINQLMMRTRDKFEVTSVIVTHDMNTARKVADRVVMLYPLNRLQPDESQILFDGPPSELDKSTDRRVTQFIHGEAGDRMTELAEQAGE